MTSIPLTSSSAMRDLYVYTHVLGVDAWQLQKVPYILVVGKAEAAEGWWERRTKAASTEKRPPLIVDAMIAEMRERVERKT